MLELTGGERRRLRAQAHKLHPVVTVGDKGLTAAVLQAIDASLDSHELIKVKVASEDRAAREALLGEICAAVDASPVQHIGKILVLYRENPLVQASPAPTAAPARTARIPSRSRPGPKPRARSVPAAKGAKGPPARKRPAR